MNLFKSILSKLKNIIISFFIRLSISMAKTENSLLKNTKDNDHSGDGNEIKNIQNDLLRSLYNGEYNKEYVEKFYKILKKSDEIVNKKYNFTDEDFYKKTNMDDSKEVIIIDMITNKVEIKNAEDALFGNPTIKTTTIKSDDPNRIFKMEEICDYLHVKKYKDREEYLLEFYVNMIHDLNTFKDELKKFKNVYYKDKYGEKYNFLMTSLYKETKFNFYNVFKYKAIKI